jgi:EAL domain-containing protein (putative c-di-GMP-specific phosphodiesterase class I)
VAHRLNKQVIAEWVEDREVMKILTEMGTLYGQGFLFHRPAPLWEEAPELTALSVGE